MQYLALREFFFSSMPRPRLCRAGYHDEVRRGIRPVNPEGRELDQIEGRVRRCDLIQPADCLGMVFANLAGNPDAILASRFERGR